MNQTNQIAPVKIQVANINTSSLLRPVANNADIIQAWENYQDLKSKLLKNTDYQEIAGKKYIKKSGWRKLQTAFGISDEVIKEERKEHAKYFVFEVTVKATAQNGRSSFGIGSCSSSERNFAHPEHDIRSISHTRAKNRAISDLIGGGELSAEELAIPITIDPVAKVVAPKQDVVEIKSEYNANENFRSWENSGITEKQTNLLKSLIIERIENEEIREAELSGIQQLSKVEASEAIARLINNEF